MVARARRSHTPLVKLDFTTASDIRKLDSLSVNFQTNSIPLFKCVGYYRVLSNEHVGSREFWVLARYLSLMFSVLSMGDELLVAGYSMLPGASSLSGKTQGLTCWLAATC